MSSIGGVMRIAAATVAVDLGLIVTILIAQGLINDQWMYSHVGTIDPWFYLGYGLNYLDPDFFNHYYKVSRLPWVLAEFAVRSLFDPANANWVLQLTTLTLASASLYMLLRETLGRNAGFLGAALFASYMFGHASGGGDYHNTLAGALYALTWWLAVRAGRAASPPRQLFLVGGFAGLTLYTNVVFLNLLPIVAVHWLATHRLTHRGWPQLRGVILPAAAGMVAATLLLGGINWAVGRGFLFFRLQFALALSFVLDSAQQKPWWHPWSTGWFWGARYLGPWIGAALAAVATLASLAIRRLGSLSHREIHIGLFALGFLYAAVLWVAWQALGQTALDIGYFAYPLVFPLVAVVAAIAACWTKLETFRGAWLSTFVLALLLVPFVAFDHLIARFHDMLSTPLATTCSVSLVAVLAVILLGRSRLGSVVALALLALVLGVSMDRYAFASLDCRIARASQAAIDSAHRLLRREGTSQDSVWRDVLVWADQDESVDAGAWCGGAREAIRFLYFAISLASTGFGYLDSPWAVTALDDIPVDRIREVTRRNRLVAYVTADRQRVERLAMRLRENGATVSDVNLYEIGSAPVRIPLYLLRIIAPQSPRPSTTSAGPDTGTDAVAVGVSR